MFFLSSQFHKFRPIQTMEWAWKCQFHQFKSYWDSSLCKPEFTSLIAQNTSSTFFFQIIIAKHISQFLTLSSKASERSIIFVSIIRIIILVLAFLAIIFLLIKRCNHHWCSYKNEKKKPQFLSGTLQGKVLCWDKLSYEGFFSCQN